MEADAPAHDATLLLRSLKLERPHNDWRRAPDSAQPDAPAKKKPGPSRTPGVWLISFAALGAVGIAAVWLAGGHGSRALNSSQSAAPAAASVLAPAGTDLNASGYVAPMREATVSAEQTGRLELLLVKEGDTVRAGQLIARVGDAVALADRDMQSAVLASAQATLQSAQAQAEVRRLAFDRAQALHENQYVSQAALDQARAAHDIAKATVVEARAAIEHAKSALTRQSLVIAQYEVRAPFDGVVTSRNAQLGEMVSPISAGGGFTRTGIVTIVDMTAPYIDVRVNEDDIARIKLGAAATISFAGRPGATSRGTVSAIIPSADRDRGSLPVRVKIESNLEGIFPNMLAKVIIQSNREDSNR
ncbi:MAG: efflux RND transporter periplasmic adaptor subunit [bacterium]|nr:efflux RND transporter periplasmic adaptor subunit [bacterium]